MAQFLLVSQVDLKDKWRNLERQNAVGPNDIGPPPDQPSECADGDDESPGQIPSAAIDVGPTAAEEHGAIPMFPEGGVAAVDVPAGTSLAHVPEVHISMGHGMAAELATLTC